MKRSFINLFAIIVILVSLIGSGIQVLPASALGATQNTTPPLPAGWSSIDLHGVWGSSNTNVYVVGEAAKSNPTPPPPSTTAPVIYQGSGTSWTPSVPSQPADWKSRSLMAVWGSDSTHIWAVGSGNDAASNLMPLIYSSNGTTWSYISTINWAAGGWTSGSMESVWGTSTSDVYAVGSGTSGGITKPLIYHYDTSWNPVSLPDLAGLAFPHLLGVWVASTGEVYAVGWGNSGSLTVPLVYSKVGGNWSASSLSLPSSTWNTGELEAVWGTSANDVYAVGSGTNSGVTMPLVYHFNGTTWSASTPSLPATGWSGGRLYAIWGNATDAYAAGWGNNSGTTSLLYRKISQSSNSWAAYSDGTSGSYDGIWGWSTTNVYAVGGNRISHAGPDSSLPGAPASFQALPGVCDGSINLRWVAPTDDVNNLNSGPVNQYFVRYSLSDITDEAAWNAATPITSGVPTPATPGTIQTMMISGLDMNTTYYFAVRAQDEEGGTSGFVTANGMPKAPIPLGGGMYDGADPAWTYTGSWEQYNTAGPYGDTYNYTNVQNSSASLIFNGTSFTLYFTRYPNRGNVEVWIDGVLKYTFSEYGPLAMQQTWVLPTPLTDGRHTLEFRNPNANSSIYMDIDAIKIVGPVDPVGPGMYDDANSHWVYTGSWDTAGGAGPYNATYHYNNVQNSSASLTFNGTSFTLYFTQYPNRGDVQVWIDGVQKYTFSEYGGALAWQQSWTLPIPLTDGRHTVEFRNSNASSATYIDIDAIRIAGPVGGGMYDGADPAWSYVGTWEQYNTAGPYGDTYNYTNVQNSSASLIFNGTSFTLYFTQYPNRGDVQVWIDGVLKYTFSEYGGTLAMQQTWVLPTPLTDGTHMVEFRNPNANSSIYMDIDAIKIVGPMAPVGSGIYDDANSHWVYTGSWDTAGGAGPYNATYHYNNVQNSSASLTFSGTSFTLYFTQYPNRGNVQVWIDGVQKYTFSEYGGALAWQQSWTLPIPLTDGTHTVEFRNSNASSSTYIDIDAIKIVGPGMAVCAGIYDGADPAWTYTGSWEQYNTAGPYSSTYNYSNVQNSSASLTFSGTSFTLYFTRYPNRGNVEVWIDGVQKYTFSENGPLAMQQTWVLPTPLTDGIHTVEFRNPNASSATYIDIDAIKIGAAEPVNPGTYDGADPAWSYAGTWEQYNTAGPYGDTYNYSNVQNSSASITFNGTSFTLYFTRYPNRGNVEVWIDGVQKYTFSENGPLAMRQTWVLPTPLTNGRHTVEFRNPNASSATYIDIDAITIQ